MFITAEFESKVINAMISEGITPPDSLKNQFNNFHRFNAKNGNHKSSHASAWYCFSVTDEGKVCCSFGDWRSYGQTTTIFENDQKTALSPEKKAQIHKMKEQLALEDKRQKEEGINNLNKAQQSLTKADSHPYLSNKGFSKEQQKSYEIYTNKRGDLYIPVKDIRTKELINFQIIYFNKEKQHFDKRFVKYCPFKYGYVYLGDNNDKLAKNNAIYGLAEGFATALEVKNSIGTNMFVAFNADNLKNIAKTLIHQYKLNPKQILNFADNDRFTKLTQPKIGNKGVKIAKDLFDFYKIESVIPAFNDDYAKQISDFNDLRIVLGEQYLKKNVLEQITPIMDRQQLDKNIKQFFPVFMELYFSDYCEKQRFLLQEKQDEKEKNKSSAPAYQYYSEHYLDN